jgi:hypothetical protein
MKADLSRTDLTLPIPIGAEARLYRILSPKHKPSGYDVSGVIDTVEIRRGDFQPLAAATVKNIPVSKTGKGVYIDLWA